MDIDYRVDLPDLKLDAESARVGHVRYFEAEKSLTFQSRVHIYAPFERSERCAHHATLTSAYQRYDPPFDSEIISSTEWNLIRDRIAHKANCDSVSLESRGDSSQRRALGIYLLTNQGQNLTLVFGEYQLPVERRFIVDNTGQGHVRISVHDSFLCEDGRVIPAELRKKALSFLYEFIFEMAARFEIYLGERLIYHLLPAVPPALRLSSGCTASR